MVARQKPERPAAGVVPTNSSAAVPHLLRRTKPVVTVRGNHRRLVRALGPEQFRNVIASEGPRQSSRWHLYWQNQREPKVKFARNFCHTR